MSEDEQRNAANIEADDEVEAHKRTAAANEEAGDENEVEAHMRHTSADDSRRAARPT
ncbi:MAG: hypothetical protein QOI27_1060 [Gaiellaceae bacterium]|nr:hypothetical protein [Gaiellaceae bacterium]